MSIGVRTKERGFGCLVPVAAWTCGTMACECKGFGLGGVGPDALIGLGPERFGALRNSLESSGPWSSLVWTEHYASPYAMSGAGLSAREIAIVFQHLVSNGYRNVA